MVCSMRLIREGNRNLLAIFGVMTVSALNPQFESVGTTVEVSRNSGTGICDVTVWISEESTHEHKAVTITFDMTQDAGILASLLRGADIILIASPNVEDFTDTNTDLEAWSAIDGGYVYVHLTDSDRQLIKRCFS